jgi:hypothetical protein
MQVRVNNAKSDYYGAVATVDEAIWASDSWLVPVRMGGREITCLRMNLGLCAVLPDNVRLSGFRDIAF